MPQAMVGITGKPNVGKSTFFSAATLAPAEIASYPFTTREPNRGIAYVRGKCPHLETDHPCDPHNAPCDNGTRLVPVEMLDVAGLVPDAHRGRGLGNKFLDDLRQAHAFIHVVDVSGSTDFEGNPCPIGEHDPIEDVKFLEVEIAHWIKGIILRDWDRIARRAEIEGLSLEKLLSDRLAGLGLKEAQVTAAVRESGLDPRPRHWDEEDMLRLARNVQRYGKPMIICANKSDIAPEENLRALASLRDYTVIPTCSDCELGLKRAAKAKLIEYTAGSGSFEIVDSSRLSPAQARALECMSSMLTKFGDTGVQRCVEELMYKVLNMIVVYPVEDETKWTDKDGRILPDAFLMPKGSNAKDLAYKVHTDLGENFIRGINARTKRVVGHDYELRDGDIIKIVART